MAIDITQDIAHGVGDVTLVVAQARALLQLEQEIDRLEQQLKDRKADYTRLATETLPTLMDTVGVESLALANGYALELRPVFRASLPAKSTIEKADSDTQPQLIQRLKSGLDWLRRHEAEDIIRSTLRIDLGKGQGKAAREILALAKRLHVSVDRSETVHPGTLSSFLKEKLRQGVTVPMDTFGVFDGREATIKAPKRKKGEAK